MTSKNTALLDMPIAELVKEVYGKAEELKLSFPEISALLRAAAGRIDVFNALLVLSSSVNVQRYSPDYQMHLNHEMAIMRPTDKGTFVSLGDYVALLKERNEYAQEIDVRTSMIASRDFDIERLNEQVRALAVKWTLVTESGNPTIPVGERAEFWVCHVSKDGKHSVAKLTWFNHVEPHADDQDAIDCCEMSTPEGENYWPVGWHEEFSSHDFDHFYEPSRLKVVAYAQFFAPEAPINLRAGELQS